MVAIGFGQGLTPLISVSWGAGEHKTAMELRQLTNRILFVIGALFAIFSSFLERVMPVSLAAAMEWPIWYP